MILYTLLLLIAVLVLIYKYLTRDYDYWKKKSIPFVPPTPIFGSMKDSLLLRKGLGHVYQDIYRSMPNEPIVGFYRVLQPALLIRDPEIIKDVLVKNFESFHDNDFQVDVKVDPMFGRNPFILAGPMWKIVRGQLGPSYTSGRMKPLVPVINQISQNLVTYIENAKDGLIDTKETSAKFLTDVIASCVFGLEGNSFVDPNAEFRQMGRLIIEPSTYNNIVQTIVILLPMLQGLFSARVIPASVEKWFRNTIGKTVQYREENNISRPDFLQTLMDLRHKPGPYEFTMDDVCAHSILFFTDGFETSSTLLGYTFYALARHLEIQNKLREEVLSVLEKHDGVITYEAVQEMTYMDMVVSESLRMYPPIPYMNRLCTKETKILNLDVKVGTSVVIPTLALQHDSQYYPNPEVFDPERFSEENLKNLNKYVFMPWGEGPRICLGMRLALLQSKIGIATVMRNFELRTCKETPQKLTYKPNFLLAPRQNLIVKFIKRTN